MHIPNEVEELILAIRTKTKARVHFEQRQIKYVHE